MKTPEDEAFEQVEKSQGWRSMQGADLRDNGHVYIKTVAMPPTRNEVLEEVASEFDKMRSLGDTAASFAAYVRNMKR